MDVELAKKADKAAEQMAKAAAEFSPIALASSLSAEDMVLTDLILTRKLNVSIFTLETGRLAPETVAMIGKIKERYGVEIDVIRPDPAAVETYVKTHGLNAFYDSVDQRHACCGIRKVEPLNRALAGKKAWVTGQRRGQSMGRSDLPEVDWDSGRNIAKYNPLAEWSWDDVLAYAAANDVPINPLHARGYPSIGCDPCTRAIRPGEDPRAGRWWWEQDDKKECGLHVDHPGHADHVGEDQTAVREEARPGAT